MERISYRNNKKRNNSSYATEYLEEESINCGIRKIHLIINYPLISVRTWGVNSSLGHSLFICKMVLVILTGLSKDKNYALHLMVPIIQAKPTGISERKLRE